VLKEYEIKKKYYDNFTNMNARKKATTTSFITKLTKKFLQHNKSIQKGVIVTQDN